MMDKKNKILFERRRYERIIVTYPVYLTIKTNGSKYLRAETRNLSKNGSMCVIVKEPNENIKKLLTKNTRLQVSIRLPTVKTPVEKQGRVVWLITENGGSYILGIEFQSLL